jgi:hypothetical protein
MLHKANGTVHSLLGSVSDIQFMLPLNIFVVLQLSAELLFKLGLSFKYVIFKCFKFINSERNRIITLLIKYLAIGLFGDCGSGYFHSRLVYG